MTEQQVKQILLDEELITPDYNIGMVSHLEVVERTNKETKQKYNKIKVFVKSGNRSYTKEWGVDFARNYIMNQLKADADSIKGTPCAFTVDPRYKNIKHIVFFNITPAGDGDDTPVVEWIPYEEPAPDFTSQLKALGFLK